MVLYKLFFVFIFLFQLIVAQFSLTPYTTQIYAAYKSVELKWETILALNLGFNQQQPIVYNVVNAFEYWMASFAVCFVACSDLLYSSAVQVLVMELDILGQIISNINLRNENEEEAIKKLKELVKIHQELIEISENLEEIFSPILLINSFGSIASICTACFLAVVQFDNFNCL